MDIKEIQEAKMNLEHEIESALNEFDKKFGTKICGVGHSFCDTITFLGEAPDIAFHCIKLKIEI